MIFDLRLHDAVFMLLVALKYYQQSIIRSDDWTGQETLSTESSWGQGKCNGRQQAEFEKQKKVCWDHDDASKTCHATSLK